MDRLGDLWHPTKLDVGWMFLICYMHDSLILCDAEVEHLIHQTDRTVFEAVSGLHVHWRKSLLFSVTVMPQLYRLAGNLAYEIGSLPTRYLGLASEICDGVIERCVERLTK